MTQFRIKHPLDWGEHYHLNLEYTTQTRALTGNITGPAGSNGAVERHLAEEMLVLEANELPLIIKIKSGTLEHNPTFTATIPPKLGDDFGLNIRVGQRILSDGEKFGHLHIVGDKVKTHDITQRLTVFETRMLGNEERYRRLPYPRPEQGPHPLTTDLHTHSSGQISAQGLIDVACKHNIAYPTRLLDDLHITDYPKNHIVRTRRFAFPPTDAGKDIPKEEDAVPMRSLSEESLVKLRAALSIPPDRQITFGNLEATVYRYRTPISKHPDVAYDLLEKTAEEYAKHRINYAEITATSGSLLTPENLEFLDKALPDIEKKTGVKLRFLVGIPRNLPSGEMEHEVEKIKIMGASPYIVGIDFMGFEDNKINRLEMYIASVARWASRHDPDFTLRIHAGENRKNLSNVKESLRLADDYGMRVRIGHAAHGLDDEAIGIAQKLAKRGLVMIEFNPDSNLALNNIDRAEELNIVKCIDEHIPFVICSDGGGLYQTDAAQLWTTAGFAANFAGIESRLAPAVRQSEEDHLAREERRFSRKEAAWKNHSPEEIRGAFAALNKPVRIPDVDNSERFQTQLRENNILFTPKDIQAATLGKKPLMILGASGNRYWNAINREDKGQIQLTVDAMLRQLDPQKVYFMIGRPKDEGITAMLSRAVQDYNNSHEEHERFSLISATVQADQTMHSFTPGLTHVLPLEGNLFNVPDQLVSTVIEKKGHILFIGGGTFTRDAILVARDKQASFGVMKGPEGASTDKAVMMSPAHQFKGAEGLIEHLHATHPELFRTAFRRNHEDAGT